MSLRPTPRLLCTQRCASLVDFLGRRPPQHSPPFSVFSPRLCLLGISLMLCGPPLLVSPRVCFHALSLSLSLSRSLSLSLPPSLSLSHCALPSTLIYPFSCMLLSHTLNVFLRKAVGCKDENLVDKASFSHHHVELAARQLALSLSFSLSLSLSPYLLPSLYLSGPASPSSLCHLSNTHLSEQHRATASPERERGRKVGGCGG